MFLPPRYSELLHDTLKKIPAPRHPAPRWVLPLLGLTGLIGAMAWGFAEATLFFIVPDVLITLIALFSFKKSLLAILLAAMGAVVGGLVMYQWATTSPDSARDAVMSVPFVTPRMQQAVQAKYKANLKTALFNGPLSGIPFKVYAVEAAQTYYFVPFLMLSFFARLERFVIVWALFVPLGIYLRSRKRDKTKLALWIWGGFWLATYALYWTTA